MARVSAKSRSVKPIDEIAAEVLEYQVIKGQVDELEKRKKALRDSLMEIVKVLGEPDDKGHLWMPLDAEVGGVCSVMAERRVSQSLNEERAQEILEERGLTERCTKMVRVVDHDEVMACLYDEELTEHDVDAMFDNNVTFALRLK
jgi:chaperonin cofactor prefoldin